MFYQKLYGKKMYFLSSTAILSQIWLPCNQAPSRFLDRQVLF